jgi:hypothetical protein
VNRATEGNQKGDFVMMQRRKVIRIAVKRVDRKGAERLQALMGLLLFGTLVAIYVSRLTLV